MLSLSSFFGFVSRFVLITVLTQELPKMYYMLSESEYHVFPKYDGPISESPKPWLLVHTILSISITAFLACKLSGVLFRKITDNVMTGVFLMWTLLVIWNSNNLAGIPHETASKINVGIVLLLEALILDPSTMGTRWNSTPFCGFFMLVFTSPVWLNFFLLYKNEKWTELVFQVLFCASGALSAR